MDKNEKQGTRIQDIAPAGPELKEESLRLVAGGKVAVFTRTGGGEAGNGTDYHDEEF